MLASQAQFSHNCVCEKKKPASSTLTLFVVGASADLIVAIGRQIESIHHTRIYIVLLQNHFTTFSGKGDTKGSCKSEFQL